MTCSRQLGQCRPSTTRLNTPKEHKKTRVSELYQSNLAESSCPSHKTVLPSHNAPNFHNPVRSLWHTPWGVRACCPRSESVVACGEFVISPSQLNVVPKRQSLRQEKHNYELVTPEAILENDNLTLFIADLI